MKHTEYIVPIGEEAKEFDEIFIGVLRKHKELIRCKDCKYFSQTTLGMDYACWHGASMVWGETGERAKHHVCERVESPDHYCGYAERRKG